jgi:hypothetical protein
MRQTSSARRMYFRREKEEEEGKQFQLKNRCESESLAGN